jgi:hypothetical protein
MNPFGAASFEALKQEASMIRIATLALSLTALVACGGGGDAVENTAEQLENAAAQSDPAAAAVLNNAADQVLEQNSTAPAQGALEAAGNAQVQSTNAGPMQPPAQAKPHAKGDPVPPPKVTPNGQAQ